MTHQISPLQERDVTLAITFLMLLIWLFTKNAIFIYVAMLVLLFGMIWSKGMRPLARVWFSMSNAIGKIMSTILLTLVYFLVVLPIALIRRTMGKDTLQLRQKAKNASTYFKIREHSFTPEDLKHPY